MILTELFSQELVGMDVNPAHGTDPNQPSDRYDPENDQTIVTKRDTRKVRLTLRQINKLRKLREIRTIEKFEDSKQAARQYGPSDEDGGGSGPSSTPW